MIVAEKQSFIAKIHTLIYTRRILNTKHTIHRYTNKQYMQIQLDK